MRITGLEIQGFRGFPRTCIFDLDSDAVVVVGDNGQGKTSFFDAILWGLTGKVARLGDDDRNVLSMYSESGEARVRVDLRDSLNSTWQVVRLYDGNSTQLRVEHDGQVLQGASAVSGLVEAMWPEALRTPDPLGTMSAAITRGVYM